MLIMLHSLRWSKGIEGDVNDYEMRDRRAGEILNP